MSGRDAMTTPRRVQAIIAIAAAALALTACVGEAAPTVATASDSAPPPTATPTPPTAAEQLLAGSGDPAACAVSFEIDGAVVDPVLETTDTLYAALPIPRADGRVFAGWYPTEADATTPATEHRINGADLVSCTARQRILYGAWTTPEAVAAENARVPILMYHQFTTRPEGEDGWLRGNYAYIGDFTAQMDHIATGGFYLPTWDELSAFIDGALFLPDHSVIITDDDAHPTWFDLAAPVIEHRGLLATSFVITSDGVRPQNRFVLSRSHTHAMHVAGANGKGQMVNLTPEQIAADMQTSADLLGGVTEVMAYPFGHYDDRSKAGLRLAGFDMARTIEQGYVSVGTDKLALPCIRINYGMGVADLESLIG